MLARFIGVTAMDALPYLRFDLLHAWRYRQVGAPVTPTMGDLGDWAPADVPASTPLPLLEVVMVTMVAIDAFELVMDLLQRQELEKRVPDPALQRVVGQVSKGEGDSASFADKLTAAFPAARAYALERMDFAVFTRLIKLILVLVTVATGVWPLLWDAGGELLGAIGPEWAVQHEVARSLMFLTLSQVWDTLLELPFSIYSQFVIEEAHGFNKMTPRLFATDLAKQLVLMAVIGLPLSALVVATIQWAGPSFHNWLMLIIVTVMVGAQVLMPTVIMPLFNKFEALPEGDLKARIEALAASLGFPLGQLSVMDGSSRSAHSNAFFMGLPFLPKRIVLYDTLVEQATEDEIVAVLAHELGHWAHNHTLGLQGVSLLLMYVQLAAFSVGIAWPALYTTFGFASQPTLVGLLLFSNVVFQPFSPLLNFFMSAVSRAAEFDADAFAVGQGKAEHLQAALLRLGMENKSPQRNHWLYSAYHHSHPPLPERLAAIQAAAAAAAKRQD